VGYYLGGEFIKSLTGKYDLTGLANLTLDEVYNEFKYWAEN
jgi:hypothetical protein